MQSDSGKRLQYNDQPEYPNSWNDWPDDLFVNLRKPIVELLNFIDIDEVSVTNEHGTSKYRFAPVPPKPEFEYDTDYFLDELSEIREDIGRIDKCGMNNLDRNKFAHESASRLEQLAESIREELNNNYKKAGKWEAAGGTY